MKPQKIIEELRTINISGLQICRFRPRESQHWGRYQLKAFHQLAD